jgi:hypothetical protein
MMGDTNHEQQQQQERTQTQPDKHIIYKVQYYAGCDPFMGLSYFNYGRKPALFLSSQIFFYR